MEWLSFRVKTIGHISLSDTQFSANDTSSAWSMMLNVTFGALRFSQEQGQACSYRQPIFSNFLVRNADVTADVKFILIEDTETHSFS
jgi:hypothetical protein